VAFVGATLIDGTGRQPYVNAAIVVREGRVEWVGKRPELASASSRTVVDLSGAFVVPGLLDANVHLFGHFDPEVILRYEPGRYDELILEAAQVALNAGLTTVFDTWGPLDSLRRVRDVINAGKSDGARIFFAGNIIGNDGPWSEDFVGRVYGPVLNPSVVTRINSHWECGVGGDLPWMDAADVQTCVHQYIASGGIDFVTYSGSVRRDVKFICFSPNQQRAIVEEAHSAGLTAQASATTPEALKLAIEAGVDLLQHGNITGRHAIPDETIETIIERQLPCVAFLVTRRHAQAALQSAGYARLADMFRSQEENNRALIRGGAKLAFGDDAILWGPTARTSRAWGEYVDVEDLYMDLGRSHILWFRAAIEQGMTPMDALLAATRNVADAYQKSDELGTIEVGKRADLLVLNSNPLANPDNYADIRHVIKDGRIVDRDRLPERPALTGESTWVDDAA
jgi:imidazolonepropionase-like amidohydrolase